MISDVHHYWCTHTYQDIRFLLYNFFVLFRLCVCVRVYLRLTILKWARPFLKRVKSLETCFGGIFLLHTLTKHSIPTLSCLYDFMLSYKYVLYTARYNRCFVEGIVHLPSYKRDCSIYFIYIRFSIYVSMLYLCRYKHRTNNLWHWNKLASYKYKDKA